MSRHEDDLAAKCVLNGLVESETVSYDEENPEFEDFYLNRAEKRCRETRQGGAGGRRVSFALPFELKDFRRLPVDTRGAAVRHLDCSPTG